MKRSNANLITLNVVFVVCLIVANVVTSKVLDTGIHIGGVPVLIPGAALTYALTFLCTDVIGEIWGKKEANKAVIRGFAAQLIALALIILTMYLPAYDEEMQRAYRMLLGQTPIFVFGSLVAYLCSQSWDVWVFHKIRGRFCGNPKRRWIWNNASTLTSQIIDTAIYISIAFGIGLGWFMQEGGMMLILGMVIGQYLLKAGLALCDTPFFYLLTRKYQKNSNVLRFQTNGDRGKPSADPLLQKPMPAVARPQLGRNGVLQGKKLNADGMVCDFKRIKDKIHGYLDHGNFNKLLPFNPTAENIARWIVEQIPECYKATVQESEGNVAIYVADTNKDEEGAL